MNTATTNRVSHGLMLSFSTNPRDAVAQSILAESLGFDSVWLGEHFVRPAVLKSKYLYGATRAPLSAREDCSDPIAVAAAIAASTSRIRIGTSIYLFPLRHPLVAARSAATLQVLSGDRFLLGVAGGWAKEEYDALGIPFEQRGARMDEGLEVFRKALSGGDLDHHGKYYSFKSVSVVNTDRSTPVLIGGASEPALRRAARLGDGWIAPPDMSLGECATAKARIDDMRREFGTEQRPFTVYVRVPDANPEDIQRYADVGLTHVTVGGRQVFDPADPLDQKLLSLERTAKRLGLS